MFKIIAVQFAVLMLCLPHVYGRYRLKDYRFEDDSVLEVTTGSYTNCKESCNAKVACLDVRYDRYYKICILYKAEVQLISNQNPRFRKHQSLIIEQQNVTGCNGCARENCKNIFGNYSCEIAVCPAPDKVNGAIILGNSNVIAAKRRYQCSVNTSRSYETQCLKNGSWSYGNINCVDNKCTLQSSLTNGIWTLERLNSTHFYANATCNTGYDLRMPEMAVCDINTGDWSWLELICCDIYNSDFGLKIYNRPAYVAGGQLVSWRYGKGMYDNMYSKHCFYRNASIIDNWPNYQIDVITFRVIKNDTEVAYLKFNGTSSTNMNWFAKDRLIENSWRDLSKTSDTQYFGILGYGGGSIDTQRFLVSKSTDPNGNCLNDRVWLAVTWHHYPCGNTSNYATPRILYAKNNTVSQYVVDEIGFADKFEVWINPIP